MPPVYLPILGILYWTRLFLGQNHHFYEKKALNIHPIKQILEE
ncbi:MAG: hypothetical protein RL757_2838 [Bacteroidota bacterium]|jgi:hypothetical protein